MTVDLDRNSKVYAIQVNFADQDATAWENRIPYITNTG